MVNTPKAGGIADRPSLLLQSNLMMDHIHLISIREIIMIILGEKLRDSSAYKISVSLYKSESGR